MATSPIYNWPEPDNTDLVKNGALAMRTLGDAIDTTMATMTPKSTYTAKGSIAAATAASTPANLTVGSNGQVLVADSSATAGLRWTSTPAASNPVLNAAFQVWQRGTSFSIAASSGITYTADRWQTATGANQAITVSRQATSDTTNLPNIQYGLRYQRNSGQTGTAFLGLIQNFESLNSIPFAGKTITVSFYARAGANYSATSSAFNFQLLTGTGTDQNVYNGYTGTAVPINTNFTLTTTWQRFTVTGTLAATATELAISAGFTPTGTAGANDYYELTGVQIDIGNVALPFRTAGVSYQQELALCQRYFTKSYNIETTAPTTTLVNVNVAPGGVTTINGGYYMNILFKQTMRIAPTIIVYSYNNTVNAITEIGTGLDKAASSAVASSGYIGQNSFAITNSSGAPITFTNGGIFHYTASAEL